MRQEEDWGRVLVIRAAKKPLRMSVSRDYPASQQTSQADRTGYSQQSMTYSMTPLLQTTAEHNIFVRISQVRHSYLQQACKTAGEIN